MRVEITPLYRAKLTCRVGRDFLDKKKSRALLPDINFALEQAMFSLLHAIEDIALALEQTNEKLQQIEGIVKIASSPTRTNRNTTKGDPL